MTSKLLRTIVGVGIALGAAPACLGRSEIAGDVPFGMAGEPENDGPSDARAPEGGPVDAGAPDRVDPVDAGAPYSVGPIDSGSPILDATTDAPVIDASGDASADPFCDVAWPPTKGGPFPPNAPCYDPFHECDDAEVPRGCFRLSGPGNCSYDRSWEGPLICVDGEWRCPPGSEDGVRCVCFGLPAGESCATDAGG